MIVFPALAAVVSLLCAAVVGWDAVKRPRPERLIWTAAFLVFAVAAAAEVVGAAAGWSANLARLYYLLGAVLVVGILALGELYLLLPNHMPALAPGITLLVIAVAVTAVWSAPVDATQLADEGWRAIERGPLLVALAATINAGGTLVLVGGALVSAWKLRQIGTSSRRAAGCVLIASGTIVVALGGTLTRFGRPEYLYLAMVVGIATIFVGVLLTRQPASVAEPVRQAISSGEAGPKRPRLIPLPRRHQPELATLAAADEGVRYLVDHLLAGTDAEVLEACRRWSATPFAADVLTRQQAQQVWALRVALPEADRPRFDALPLAAQAQLAELYDAVWSNPPSTASHERRA
jgi:hypothetical protein